MNAVEDPNRNARWCRLIAEELHRAGAEHVVLCPGSRNSPLLFALAREFGGHAHSHIDERSAGFIAIGLIRATGRPAAVCVTSGSALANLLPALTEADASGLPLIAISADRPWEAHGNGAPQSMPQHGILAAFVRASLALGEPSDGDTALRALRAQVSRLAQERRGPTHLNVPLRDPLPPLPDPAWTPGPVSPEALHGRTRVDEGGGAEPGPYTLQITGDSPRAHRPEPWMRPGLRGLIVVGCLAEDLRIFVRAVVQELAEATGFPVLADAASSVRSTDVHGLVTTHDALVSGALGAELPEVVIQIGPAPLARAVYEWLDRCRCPWWVFSRHGDQDMLSRATTAVTGDWGRVAQQLGGWLAPGDQAWAARWCIAEARARAALAQATAALGWSESLAVRLAVNHPGFGFVHLASSMSVRHANLHLAPRTTPVHANRGVNGIDGTLGTFLGLARGHRRRGLVLLGDLAFLHDLPALAAAGLAAAGGALVVVNNGGGGIFDYLPVAQVPAYDQWVRTTHQRTFSGAAELFGLVYHPCRSTADLERALDTAAADQRLHLIECLLPGSDAVAQHRALLRAAAGLDGNAATR